MAEGVRRAPGNPPGAPAPWGTASLLVGAGSATVLPFGAPTVISGPHGFPVQKKQEQKAPDRDAIARATASLPPCNMDRAVVQTGVRDVSAAGGVGCGAQEPRVLYNVFVNLQLLLE